MTTIKAYTDLKQSKELSEILLLESADMSYSFNFNSEVYESSTAPYKDWIVPKYAQPDDGFGQVIPCWSLAVLLEKLENIDSLELEIEYYNGQYYLFYMDDWCSIIIETGYHNSLVDACVEMIFKLKEKDLL